MSVCGRVKGGMHTHTYTHTTTRRTIHQSINQSHHAPPPRSPPSGSSTAAFAFTGAKRRHHTHTCTHTYRQTRIHHNHANQSIRATHLRVGRNEVPKRLDQHQAGALHLLEGEVVRGRVEPASCRGVVCVSLVDRCGRL